MNSYKLTSDRTAHISADADDDIITLALAARSELIKARVSAHDKIREALNSGIIVPHNAGVLADRLAGAGPTGPFMNPVRRKAGNRATTLRRSFRFTIEGRPGKFKLDPVHAAPTGIFAARANLHGAPVAGYRIEQTQA